VTLERSSIVISKMYGIAPCTVHSRLKKYVRVGEGWELRKQDDTRPSVSRSRESARALRMSKLPIPFNRSTSKVCETCGEMLELRFYAKGDGLFGYRDDCKDCRSIHVNSRADNDAEVEDLFVGNMPIEKIWKFLKLKID
jgi:hypothetical protein